jgi:hypothetical protein
VRPSKHERSKALPLQIVDHLIGINFHRDIEVVDKVSGLVFELLEISLQLGIIAVEGLVDGEALDNRGCARPKLDGPIEASCVTGIFAGSGKRMHFADFIGLGYKQRP